MSDPHLEADTLARQIGQLHKRMDTMESALLALSNRVAEEMKERAIFREKVLWRGMAGGFTGSVAGGIVFGVFVLLVWAISRSHGVP